MTGPRRHQLHPRCERGGGTETHQKRWHDPEQDDDRGEGRVKTEHREIGFAPGIKLGVVVAQPERGPPHHEPDEGRECDQPEVEIPFVRRTQHTVNE
jgi:hypothetical protein